MEYLMLYKVVFYEEDLLLRESHTNHVVTVFSAKDDKAAELEAEKRINEVRNISGRKSVSLDYLIRGKIIKS